MGSTVSITNETKRTVHVSLKQATPLYWANNLEPGQTATFGVGKVWFTVEAREAEEKNAYDTVRDAVVPISVIVVGSVATVASAGAYVVVAGGSTAAVAAAASYVSKGFTAGRIIQAVSTAKTLVEVLGGKEDNGVVFREHGVYAGSDLNLALRVNERNAHELVKIEEK